MKVTDQPSQLREWLDEARRNGATVGLHPTMGSLHGGHTANIRRAAAECDVVAVTVFVNPLQFGPGEDFDAYPRSLDADTAKAAAAGADFLLAPSTETMFPTTAQTTVTVGPLGRRWEGQHRPAHFDGVATIVTKLLAIAGPCYAYFGEKDYQQLVIVQKLVEDLSLAAVVVPCPIVREPDGLALSSRNAYLSTEERAAAPALYWALLAAKRVLARSGGRGAGAAGGATAARAAMLEVMSRQDLFRVDYAEVVGAKDLVPLEVVSVPARLIIAARCAGARLIDNIAADEEET